MIGSNWVVRRTTGPVTEFLRAIPPPALLPFAMLVFGFGLSMKVFVIAIGCVWPILLNTVDGVRGADPMFNEVARVYRLDSRSRLRRVVIPAAAPQIAVGLQGEPVHRIDPHGDQRDGGQHQRTRLLRSAGPADIPIWTTCGRGF